MASKIGRRGFLKSIGLAAASAGARMIPTLPVTDTPEVPEGMTFEGLEQIVNTGFVDRLDGEFCGLISSDDRWHSLVLTMPDGNLYVDGEFRGSLPLDKHADRVGMRVRWIPITQDRDDCPTCRELSGKPWVEPEPPPEPEYDCDYYFPISEGVCYQSWVNPVTGEGHRTAIEWSDHGLHTIFRANGQYLGEALSTEVDPFTYAHSIWAAGLVALHQIVTEREGPWPPVT